MRVTDSVGIPPQGSNVSGNNVDTLVALKLARTLKVTICRLGVLPKPVEHQRAA